MTTTQILVKHYMESHLHQNLAYILILISIGSIIYITSVIKKVIQQTELLRSSDSLFHITYFFVYIRRCDVLGVKLQQHILPCN